ncbi:MAG: hypothetical protein M3Q58_02540 [Bacteroidota bacterium]|nr:hypothetical protein [Bacteroidota bacterium]
MHPPNMDEVDKKIFINKALDKVYFYIESKFWSQPDQIRLESWLNNFKSVDEQYCAAKLLDRFVYYSEEDIYRLLKFGLYEKILKQDVLKLECMNEFETTNEKINQLIKNELGRTLFLPLSTGNVSESSLAMARYLSINLGINEKQIIGLNELKWDKLKSIKRLIIIDDFVGTGEQIIDFWNYTLVNVEGKDYSMFEIKNILSGQTSFEYLCLVTTKYGYNNFYCEEAPHNKDLTITYCEMLSDKFKVFGEKSTYFDQNEMVYNKQVLNDLCLKNKISLLGFESLDYAIAFHHGIPDASLPLFHKESATWNHLYKNKGTQHGIYV